MAAEGSTVLEIIISAVNEATAAFEEIDKSLEGVAEAAAVMTDETTASFNAFMESVSAAAAATGLDEDEIMLKMEETGQTAEQVAAEIVTANEEVDASNEVSKGSFTSVGIVAGIAFGAVMSAVDSAVSSAQKWNDTSAIIEGELTKIHSAIPLSAIQAYAVQIQNTTLLTQQQALQAEAVIFAYKNLAPQYQSLTSLGADLATKMSETSGTLSDNMPQAMQTLATALEDPVAGVNKLVRAGVELSAQQVQSIQNFAKVGDTAAADNIILTALKGSIGGLAEAAAKNDPLTQLSNQLTALGTTIANSGLLNSLNQFAQWLIPIIQGIGQWATEHPKLTEAIIAGTVAFTAFLAVMAVIGIIVAAAGSAVVGAAAIMAAAFAGVVALVVSNWKTVVTVTQDLENAFTQIFESIGIVTREEFDLVVSVFTGHFALIQTATSAAGTWLRGAFTSLMNDVKGIWNSGWSDMGSFVMSIWNTIENTVKSGVNMVISAINGFINALDSIHISIPAIQIPGTKIGTPALDLGFSIPDIPMLAAGGIVYNPVLAMIGEQGPEAVVPLSQLGSAGGGIGGGQPINVYIQGGIFPADASAIKQIGDMLAKQIVQSIKVRNYAS